MKRQEFSIEITEKKKQDKFFGIPFYGKIKNTLIGIIDTNTIETIYPFENIDDFKKPKFYFSYSLNTEADLTEIIGKIAYGGQYNEITIDEITSFSSTKYANIRETLFENLSDNLVEMPIENQDS
jgi:hypothetical protein